jgi:hypothetical protein
VYEVVEALPVAPAVKGTDTVVLFVRVTVPRVGAAGAEKTSELEAALAVDVPLAFVAVMVYVRVPAAVSVTTIGLEDPVLEAPDEEVTV